MRLEEIDTQALFIEYQNLHNFDPGGVKVFHDLDEWISTRLERYAKYRAEFSLEKMSDYAHVVHTYKEWLLYRNNFSWTTFQRVGYEALKQPTELARLLSYLQDQKIPVQDRVREGLSGRYMVAGIGKGILTAFLHTIFPDQYGVLNSRSIDTLKLLKKYPKKAGDIGHTYLEVNYKLQELACDLKTDLTTIDGFMWYISKRVKVLLPTSVTG